LYRWQLLFYRRRNYNDDYHETYYNYHNHYNLDYYDNARRFGDMR
jgi:hypothetical protein